MGLAKRAFACGGAAKTAFVAGEGEDEELPSVAGGGEDEDCLCGWRRLVGPMPNGTALSRSLCVNEGLFPLLRS